MTVVDVPVGRVVERSTCRSQLVRLARVAFTIDFAVLTASVVVAMELRFGTLDPSKSGALPLTGIALIDFGWVVPVWLGALLLQDAYSVRHFARGADEFMALLRASVLAALTASTAAYLVNYDMARGYYALVFGVGTALLLAERYSMSVMITRCRAKGAFLRRVVAVGGVGEVAALSALLKLRGHLGYELVAACTPAGPGPRLTSTAIPVLGTTDDAATVCRQVSADTLLVTGGADTSSNDLRRLGWELESSDIDLIVVPTLLDVAGPRISMRPVVGLPFIHVEQPQVAHAMRWRKTAFDRITSLLLLALLAPLMLVVAVAIKLEADGPVLFRQWRVGAHGQHFKLWKFRSMVPGADHLHTRLATEHQRPLLFKLEHDPRVTSVGRFLRRYSLDELPQLFNVLAGTMSLVGPRPPLPDEVDLYETTAHRRLRVRPGLTGLWQVSGRSDLSWDESVRLDLYYVDNWSMTGDLVILAKTVGAVLRRRGAY